MRCVIKDPYFKVSVVKQHVALLNNVKQRITQIYSWLSAYLVCLLIKILLRFGSVLANVSWFGCVQNKFSFHSASSVYHRMSLHS